MNWTSGTRQAEDVLSRKRTASEMSSGRIISSGGTWACTHSVMGVSTNAGQKAVTWMPSSISSAWAAMLKATTAAFVAEYADSHAAGYLAAIDAVFTTSA